MKHAFSTHVSGIMLNVTCNLSDVLGELTMLYLNMLETIGYSVKNSLILFSVRVTYFFYMGLGLNLNSEIDGSTITIFKLLTIISRRHQTFNMSMCVRKPTIWDPTRSDTNRAVQSQKMVRGWEFWI